MNGEVFFIIYKCSHLFPTVAVVLIPTVLFFLFGLPAVCFFEAMTLVRHSYGTFVMQVILDFGTEEPVNFQQIRPEKKRHEE